jgi:UDP-N-acetylglucosamine pyrophosphorylase
MKGEMIMVNVIFKKTGEVVAFETRKEAEIFVKMSVKITNAVTGGRLVKRDNKNNYEIVEVRA